MRIHLIEPGGRGGVYQHTLALAGALADSGCDVTLHTAEDIEHPVPAGVTWCDCIDWMRHRRRGRVRSAAVGARYVGGTLPHLRKAIARGDVAHVQGLFGQGLTTLTLAAAGRSARVVHSPHNTFSRRARRSDELFLRRDIRLADATIVFSEADRARVASWGGDAIVAPLAQYMPPLDDLPTQDWNERWGRFDGRPVVLFAGQIRPDKRLDLLLEATARRLGAWQLAVVGEDLGDQPRCMSIAHRLGVRVDWCSEYVDFGEFVAALAAADVVVCPYAQASQSGVLALARQLGTPTVASRVGGLPELATFSFESGDPEDLSRAIDAALAHRRTAPLSDLDELLEAHLAAYGGAR